LNLCEKIAETARDSVVIPDSVWDCEDLKPLDIKLYRVLLQYAKKIFSMDNGKLTIEDEPIIDVSQKTLAQKIGSTVTTTVSCLERLASVRLIHIDKYNGFKKNNHILVLGEFYGIDAKQNEDEEVYTLPKKKPEPIKRIPIMLEKDSKSKYLDKLRTIGGNTRVEKEVIAISKHYEMLVRKMNRMGGYRALSNNPTEHKNWPKFEKLYNLCKDNGWEARYYLDAQFDRAEKYWKKSKFKFPLPQMLCSKAAQEYFVDWAKEREEMYAQDLHRKEKMRAQKTLTIKQQVIRDIVRTTEMLSLYCKDGEYEERQQSKALKIYDSWGSYSAAYLYSIPWFRDYLKEIIQSGVEHPKLENVQKEFQLYDKSKKLQSVIKKTVSMAEEEFEIPENLVI
jgi:hypothetical protein